MSATNGNFTPRERMRRAMNHQEPDRVPFDFGSTAVTSIAGMAYEKLKCHLGMPSETRIMTKQGQVAYVDEGILDIFGIDTRPLDPGAPDNWMDIEIDPLTYQDEWGVQWQRPEESNSYFLFKGSFEGDEMGTLEAIRRFRWPDPNDPGRFRGLRERASKLHEDTDYAVVFSPRATFWQEAARIRGFGDFFSDLVTNKKFVHALLDKILEIRLEITERMMAETRGLIDVVLFSDDLGTQSGPMISMQMYEEFVKPRQQLMVDAMKKSRPWRKNSFSLRWMHRHVSSAFD